MDCCWLAALSSRSLEAWSSIRCDRILLTHRLSQWVDYFLFEIDLTKGHRLRHSFRWWARISLPAGDLLIDIWTASRLESNGNRNRTVISRAKGLLKGSHRLWGACYLTDYWQTDRRNNNDGKWIAQHVLTDDAPYNEWCISFFLQSNFCFFSWCIGDACSSFSS